MKTKKNVLKLLWKILKVLFVLYIFYGIVMSSYMVTKIIFKNISNNPAFEMNSLFEMGAKMVGEKYTGMISGPDSIEKQIFDFTDNVKIERGGKVYKTEDLDELIDSSFNDLLSRSIPKYSFSNEYFSMWYYNEGKFWNIVEQIDSLDTNKKTYESYVTSKISTMIDSVSSKDERIYLYLYLYKHFISILNADTILQKNMDYVYSIMNKNNIHTQNDQAPTYYNQSERIRCLLIIGDFCESIGREYQAIQIYKQAYNRAEKPNYAYKMAAIEERIASLYYHFFNDDYAKRAMLHYKNASYIYTFTSDSRAAAVSLQKAISIQCWLLHDKADATNYDLELIKKTLIEGLNFTHGRTFEKEDYYLYIGLGIYCKRLGYSQNLQAASTFYKLSAIAAMEDIHNDKDIDNVCLALDNNAYVYAMLNDEKQALHYINMAIQFADSSNISDKKTHYIFEKANVLRILCKYEEALSLITEEYKHNPDAQYNSRGNYVAYLIYYDLYQKKSIKTYKNSADVFLKKYNDFNTNRISGIESLNKVEPYSMFSHYQELIEENEIIKRELVSISLNGLTIIFWPTLIIVFLIFSGIKLRREKRKIGNEKKNLEILSERLEKEKNEIEQNRKQSDIHSAISRVLSRCLSHNIGSHALSKFIDKDKVTVADTDIQYKSGFVLSGTEQELLAQPALIASFNEYLKHRMDLLADIATTTSPVMESPMYLVRDIVNGLDKNRILLNRISGVTPRINFSFKVVYNGVEIRNFSHQKDPALSMTNDLLGAQAFYIILENIIRNIYKHGNPVDDFQVVIDVNQCKADNSYYEINVFDTLPKSIKEVEDIVLKRNESFNEPVFYKNNLRDHNLGSIEMAVCSCYLRCLPVDTFTNESYKINVKSPSNDPSSSIIHAYVHRLDGEEACSLGYSFFISKPKQVLVVSENKFQLAGKSDILLNDIGTSVISPGDLNNDLISKHQFIYLDKGVEDKVAILFPSQLPKRIVQYSDALQFDTIEGFIASLWQQYLMNNYSKFSSVSFKYYNENHKLFFSSDTEAENNFSVYIDNHDSKWVCRECKTINENCFDHTSGNTADCEPLASFSYYDMACGHSRLTKAIMRGMIFPGKLPDELIRQKILQSEYAENVLTRIMILDERIQHNLVIEAKLYRGKVPLYDYFFQQGVWIPKKQEANLNHESFGTLLEPESEASKIRNFISERIDETNFCVMHLGILEKMLKSGSSKSREAIDELINSLFLVGEQRRKLIITSNRGGALNIPNDICYVPFPLVQNALETLNDKFVLTNILFNSRKCI